MSLAAAMVASGRANRVTINVFSGSPTWTATFTGTVWITCIAPGGTHGGNTASGGLGGGGGGGGGYMGNVPLSVTSGDVVNAAYAAGTTSTVDVVNIRRNGVLLGQVGAGLNASNYSDGRGTTGGGVSWTPLSVTLSPGLGGVSAAGTDGASTLIGSAVFIAGGGGGGGNTVTPAVTGFSGGNAGTYYSAQMPVGVWGGGGAGFNPGASRLTSTTTTPVGAWQFFLEW